MQYLREVVLKHLVALEISHFLHYNVINCRAFSCGESPWSCCLWTVRSFSAQITLGDGVEGAADALAALGCAASFLRHWRKVELHYVKEKWKDCVRSSDFNFLKARQWQWWSLVFLFICGLFRRRVTQPSSHGPSTHSGFDRGCGFLGWQEWGLVILLPGLEHSTDLLNTALPLQQSVSTAAR